MKTGGEQISLQSSRMSIRKIWGTTGQPPSPHSLGKGWRKSSWKLFPNT